MRFMLYEYWSTETEPSHLSHTRIQLYDNDADEVFSFKKTLLFQHNLSFAYSGQSLSSLVDLTILVIWGRICCR